MDERIDQSDLKLDLLAPQRGRTRQGRNMVESAGELFCGFDDCRACERSLSRFAPQSRSFLNESGFAAVARQQFRLTLSDVGEVRFESFGDSSMKLPSLLAQQCPICRILNQGVFEEIISMRWNALPRDQASLDETLHRRRQFRVGVTHYRCHKRMRKRPADCCPTLRNFPSAAEAVQPCHERRM